MLVVIGQKFEPIPVRDKAMAVVTDFSETNGRQETTAPLPNLRKKKVFTVRQQLMQGKYDLNGRLDLVLDRLLEDVIA